MVMYFTIFINTSGFVCFIMKFSWFADFLHLRPGVAQWHKYVTINVTDCGFHINSKKINIGLDLIFISSFWCLRSQVKLGVEFRHLTRHSYRIRLKLGKRSVLILRSKLNWFIYTCSSDFKSRIYLTLPIDVVDIYTKYRYF